jgi:hypothetical protein
MKVIVLVTMSYNLPIYEEHQKVWRSFMHEHPNIKSYFIISSEHVNKPICIGDIILTPGKEGYLPEISIGGARLEKTINALEFLSNQSYDFIIRTGISSLWIYSNLIEFLKTLPKENVYAGIDGGGFISGAGIIMSKDICDLLCKYKSEAYSYPYEEDYKIGQFMLNHNIPFTNATRLSIHAYEQYNYINIPSNTYHFRIKFDSQTESIRSKEIVVMKDILLKFNTHPNQTTQHPRDF